MAYILVKPVDPYALVPFCNSAYEMHYGFPPIKLWKPEDMDDPGILAANIVRFRGGHVGSRCHCQHEQNIDAFTVVAQYVEIARHWCAQGLLGGFMVLPALLDLQERLRRPEESP